MLVRRCHNSNIIHHDLRQKLTRSTDDVITVVFRSKKNMLSFRYFKKHLSRRRRSVLKLLLRSVSHHNLSAKGMNNDQSFSLIFAVGVSPYPRLGIYVFWWMRTSALWWKLFVPINFTIGRTVECIYFSYK